MILTAMNIFSCCYGQSYCNNWSENTGIAKKGIGGGSDEWVTWSDHVKILKFYGEYQTFEDVKFSWILKWESKCNALIH